MKKITTLSLGIFLLTMGMSFAQQSPLATPLAAATVEVGNKHCPVSGREVGVMGPAIKITYNGKVYHLCCPGCINSFKNNPEKFSKIAEDNAKIGK